MHKPESILENETQQIHWGFEIQTDHLIPARRPDLVMINKKKEHLPNSGLYRPGGSLSKNQRKRKERRVLGPCQITKKAVVHESDGDHIYQPPPPARYNTRSIFKWSLTGLNSEFSFSKTSCLTKAEELSLPHYLPIAGGRIFGFIPFPRVLGLCEMQLAWSRI